MFLFCLSPSMEFFAPPAVSGLLRIFPPFFLLFFLLLRWQVPACNPSCQYEYPCNSMQQRKEIYPRQQERMQCRKHSQNDQQFCQHQTGKQRWQQHRLFSFRQKQHSHRQKTKQYREQCCNGTNCQKPHLSHSLYIRKTAFYRTNRDRSF